MIRAAALALSMLMLSACGLEPVYSGGSQGIAATTLRQIEIAPIEGEAGWMMRNALIDRTGGSPNAGGQYRLEVRLDDSITGLGVRADDTVTRERRTLRARYRLVNVATNEVILDSTAGSDQGIDVVGSDYATIAAEQTALENLTGVVADQIVSRLARFAGSLQAERP